MTTEPRIPPMDQPTVDYIAGLLTMLDAEQAGSILASTMHKAVAAALDKGWAAPLANAYAVDFAERVIEAVRRPRPLQ